MNCACHKIDIRFAFYWTPDNEPPEPSYFVAEGEVPGILPNHGNVCASQIIAAGLPVPPTPTFEEWVENGSPVYRGEE
jgi:hypothetical protein